MPGDFLLLLLRLLPWVLPPGLLLVLLVLLQGSCLLALRLICMLFGPRRTIMTTGWKKEKGR